MQAIVAAQGEQPDIGDHQPLRGPVLVAVRVLTDRLGGDNVNARLRVAQNLADWDGGGDFLVALAGSQS